MKVRLRTTLRCSATSARIWSLYGKLFGMPGSFLCSRTELSTTDTHRWHKGHSMYALLFHCGFFFASLAFFFLPSLALCLIFSLWLIETRLLVSDEPQLQFTFCRVRTIGCMRLLLRIRGMTGVRRTGR